MPSPDESPPSLPVLGLQDALMLDTGGELTELDKIIAMMLDPANIGHLTELTRNEIAAFSKAVAMCKSHPIAMKAGMALLKENLIFKVSKSRKGRLEFGKILNRALTAQENAMMDPQAQRRGLFGRRK